MAEILTESFCERCGTRYTFQAAVPRRQRLGKLKVVSKGLKNYVLSDTTTLDEAFAEARSDEERDASAHQLDAFHQTFNFCMTCRQYTCANCWNDAEGRCLTCAPNLAAEIVPAAFPSLGPTLAPAGATNGHGQDGSPAESIVELDAWPEIDLLREDDLAATDDANGSASAEPEPVPEIDILARLNALAPEPLDRAPEPLDAEDDVRPAAPADDEGRSTGDVGVADVVREPEVASISPMATAAVDVDAPEPAAPDAPLATAAPEPAAPDAPLATAAPEPAAPPAPPAADSAAPEDIAEAAAARTSWLLGRFRPGESLDAEIAAYEAEAAAEVASPAVVERPLDAPATGEAALASTEMATEAAAHEPHAVEPERLAELPVAERAVAEPAAAEASVPEPAAPEPHDESRTDDRVELPTWQVVAPDPGPRPLEPPAPQPPAEWPSTPAWPATPDAPAPWTRPTAAASPRPQPAPINLGSRGRATGTDTLWAESSRDVLTRSETGVQACVSCGLPLSATARFCRRCGTSQH
jgi:ribosomal protein L40E